MAYLREHLKKAASGGQIQYNAWLLSYELFAQILVIKQKSMEKLCCVECRNSCQQIPEKDHLYVKVGRNNVHHIKSAKIVGKTLKYFLFQC